MIMNMPFSNFFLNFLQFSSVGPYWLNKEMLFIQIFFFKFVKEIWRKVCPGSFVLNIG